MSQSNINGGVTSIDQSAFRTQSGAALIEVMVSIIIFALGILGILGLQTSTVSVAADARFRTEAAALADEYIALMTLEDPANLSNYATGGSRFNEWKALRVSSTNAALRAATLPNADITVDLGAAGPAGDTPVAVTVTWLGANDNSTAARRHISKTSIPAAAPTGIIR
jgi:type IV pilus assembly protein PilV